MTKKSSAELEKAVEAVDAKITSLQNKIKELEFDKQNLKDRLSNAYYEERLSETGVDLKVIGVDEHNISGCRFLVTFEGNVQTWSAKRPKIGSTMRFAPDYIKLMEECRDAKGKVQAVKA